MPVIVIANPKGGVGKSTIATNLSGYFASRGHNVMIGDVDKQESAKKWLNLRPEQAWPISTWNVNADYIAKPPRGTTHVVLDTPAGLHGWRFNDVLRMANKIIVPIQPSLFDISATAAFLESLKDERSVRNQEVQVGLVGMRVDSRARSTEQLTNFINSLNFPFLGNLRNTQNYVQLAAHGLTLWDVAPGKVERDLLQWQNILDWVDQED
ncbi:AAA family ATPase [Ampullimonas aquatilis]|uniref:nucleotide-binding protein n=1 Tax=Ampullimonas aquatilis TaxID=1341549 RepID=UPI003C767A3C